jgi:hypothetical protein
MNPILGIMGDVGTGSSALAPGQSSTPNADQMGVDPSLEALAAFLVTGEQAWTRHDGATLNDCLQSFWQAEANYSGNLGAQSGGTLVGGTVQDDLTALDAYSHRMLGYEYMYQMSQQTPAQIQQTLPLEMAEFTKSVAEFGQVGLTKQAQNDGMILAQAQGWANGDAANWVDDSYTAAVAQVINQDLSAAGNIISAAGSALSFLQSPLVWLGIVTLAGLVLYQKVK